MNKFADRLGSWVYGNAQGPKRVRDRPMEVLALGHSRSGTDSLAQALRILGYDRVYHGYDSMMSPYDFVWWRKAWRAKWYGGEQMTIADWDNLLGDCAAVTDSHAAVFAPELMAAYPSAKAILNKRDVAAWHRSVMTNFVPKFESFWQRFSWYFCEELWLIHGFEIMFLEFFRWDFRRCGETAYLEHCDAVRGAAERLGTDLLEWQVEDGWEPLCKFLGKPVPEVEFPNGNGSPEFFMKFGSLLASFQAKADRNVYISCAVLVSVVAVAMSSIWIVLQK